MSSWHDRFTGRTRRSGSCLIFTGSIRKDGYGRIGYERRVQLAHRVSYELATGVPPADQCVLHRCDRPACVNPEHLFLGTVADNNRDMIQKRRHAVGDTHGKTRLADADVRRVRASSEQTKVLAARFGVSASCIRKIRQGVRRAANPALLLAITAALLPGCQSTTAHVADLPPACPSATPEVQIVERRIYVGISSELTAPEPVAEGPLSECPMVAAERRAAVERANAKLRAIAEKQGTEVDP